MLRKPQKSTTEKLRSSSSHTSFGATFSYPNLLLPPVGKAVKLLVTASLMAASIHIAQSYFAIIVWTTGRTCCQRLCSQRFPKASYLGYIGGVESRSFLSVLFATVLESMTPQSTKLLGTHKITLFSHSNHEFAAFGWFFVYFFKKRSLYRR